MASRVLTSGGNLHEWYAQDGSPKGSPAYAASAAAIHNAVVHGLLGVVPSADGLRVTLRVGETMLPFHVPQPVALGPLVVSQTVSPLAIEVSVRSDAPVKEVCSLLPKGTTTGELISQDLASRQSVRRIGKDTIMCADLSGATGPEQGPLHVRFALTRGAANPPSQRP